MPCSGRLGGPTLINLRERKRDYHIGTATVAEETAAGRRDYNILLAILAHIGGPVCDLGVHIVDGIHLMTGAGFPASVTARGARSKVEGLDTADRAAILIEYPNGLLVSLTIDGTAARGSRVIGYRWRRRSDRDRHSTNARYDRAEES